ncbi:glycosyl transferase family group 2-domain-containing protein [Thelephora terrestris]|uniref:Glycosyl transferase family group 2-domain-containing protein n=1 Tax=Thelephora terrestris TaxID=56493 RepID=A0A9P6HKX1_9AGAM|nr:glycosyl transferase family group 2-domain-containing protein [Thelephora terrestris]
MDYDRYDAILHHIFKQTQGDAWFRPNEDCLPCGVAIRVGEAGEFRVFPYENIALEPFEMAVAALNPAVAVKVRSAAVHATLAEAASDESSIYVDSNTRIQVVETMMDLPTADREQLAAFIRDERVLVVWAFSIETIIPTCHDFEDRLIKLLWRTRPPVPPTEVLGTPSNSLSGHSAQATNPFQTPTASRYNSVFGFFPATPGPGLTDTVTTPRSGDPEKAFLETETKTKRTWYGKRYTVDVGVDPNAPIPRPTVLYACVYNGLAAGLSLFFVCHGVGSLLKSWLLDGNYLRFALGAAIPALWCISLFFSLQIMQNLTMMIGPIAHYHTNSKYYSAIPPRPNPTVDRALPHVTIQMPVYKESLEAVLAPSIQSIKKAMKTYARQGGTSTIFINDDGLQSLRPHERSARIAYYTNHGIGWVARPPHSGEPDGFKRAGRFKKASNMNYALQLSMMLERHLGTLINQEKSGARLTPTFPSGRSKSHRFSLSTSDGAEHGAESNENDEMTLEDRALLMAIDEVHEAAGKREGFKPWAANGRAMRIGEIVLLVDSDTVVPEDCLRDAAREMAESPQVAIIQHESDVMQIAHHYFENGLAYFTRRVNRSISMACANGEVAPFVGHNAFLRWSAIQDSAFMDPADQKEKVWSEHNVSEDFDMAMRLQEKGYIIRWSTYSKGGFKEGVSLTVDDELNRWQKYSYGCSELLFNPFSKWLTKGPINRAIHRFVWCSAPLHYKLAILAYMFSYYGIAASITIGILNYVLLGLQFPVDNFYMHSFEVWLATTVVFFGSGTIAFTLLEYRLGHKELLWSFLENIKWVPFFFFFFGGLAIPLSIAIFAHMLSLNITWSATVKEVQKSNFFKEVPRILKKFWFSLTVSWIIIAGMVILSTPLVPFGWRVDATAWGVIFPLAIAAGCHILFPIVLNPWLMIFQY